jgi:hypothetical protein
MNLGEEYGKVIKTEIEQEPNKAWVVLLTSNSCMHFIIAARKRVIKLDEKTLVNNHFDW